MMTTPQVVATPQKHGAGWFVPNGAVGYFVERVEGRWRCTCPSFRWRKTGACKRIAAVIRELKGVRMG